MSVFLDMPDEMEYLLDEDLLNSVIDDVLDNEYLDVKHTTFNQAVGAIREAYEELPREQQFDRNLLEGLFDGVRIARFYRDNDIPIPTDNLINVVRNYITTRYTRLPANLSSLSKLAVLVAMGAITLQGAFKTLPEIQEEKHIPTSSNYNGAGTMVKDRIGLEHKGGKIGTKPLHIPTDISDIIAMVHDLAYYSKNNADRSIADFAYWSSAYFLNDRLNKLSEYGIVNKDDIPNIEKAYKDKFSGWSLGLSSILRQSGLADADITSITSKVAGTLLINLLRGLTPMGSELITIEDLPALSVKDLLQGGLLPTYYNVGKNIIQTLSKVYKRNIGDGDDFSNRHNELVDKMYKYLGMVGEFNDKGIFMMKQKGYNKMDILNAYNDLIDSYNSFISISDYPDDKIDRIKFTDNDKINRLIDYDNTDRVGLEPSTLTLDVVKNWLNPEDDIVEEEKEEEEIVEDYDKSSFQNIVDKIVETFPFSYYDIDYEELADYFFSIAPEEL